MAQQLGAPAWNTLFPYYDTPPTGQISTEDPGSSSTSQMAPGVPPDQRRMPRHILRDPLMCQTLTQNARNYVNQLTRLPDNHLFYIYESTQVALSLATGDEAQNVDMFALIAHYIRQFVVVADGLPHDAVRLVSCENHGGIRANRKMRRHGIDRVIIEQKSVAAFEAHAPGIQEMGSANNNQGTEIICSSSERDARSIVFKLGKHMIDTNCSWGLLVGGNEYILFYVDRVMAQGNAYHHLVISDRHAAFPPTAPQGTPSVIQVVIALLGNIGSIAYRPPLSSVGSAYVQGPRTPRPPRTSTGPKSKGSAPSKMATRSQATGGTRRRSGTLLDSTFLGSTQLCSLSYPNSGLPEREFALIRVSAKKAYTIMLGKDDDLPETSSDSFGAHPLISRAGEAGQLFGLEMLGEGVCGIVYDSLCAVNGKEEPCATKMVEKQFHVFHAEVCAYEQLSGKSFVPAFYGAFAGMWVTGPLGVLVIERLQRTFKSYDEMDMQEKHDALKCLEELHRAGYHHGDVSARNFGARGRQIVIFDFSHAGPCGECDPGKCRELKKLKENLFGKGEEG